MRQLCLNFKIDAKHENQYFTIFVSYYISSSPITGSPSQDVLPNLGDPMRKYLLLIAGLIAAPFLGSKANATEKKINRTVKVAKKTAGNKSTIEIKPIEKMLLAPQDISGSGGSRGKGPRVKKTHV
jgi:hypothetical protein